MKKFNPSFFLFLIGFIINFQTLAQKDSLKPAPLSIYLAVNDYYDIQNRQTLTVNGGFGFHKFINSNIGIGFGASTFGTTSRKNEAKNLNGDKLLAIPIFLSLKSYFTKKENRPYIEVAYGLTTTFLDNIASYDRDGFTNTYSYQNGRYGRFSVGISNTLNKRKKVFIQLNYCRLDYTEKIETTFSDNTWNSLIETNFNAREVWQAVVGINF